MSYTTYSAIDVTQFYVNFNTNILHYNLLLKFKYALKYLVCQVLLITCFMNSLIYNFICI